MRNFILSITLLAIFALDCITGVVMTVPLFPTCGDLTSADAVYAQQMEIWQSHMLQYCEQKSIMFILYPLILILGYVFARFYKATIDLADIFIAALVTFTSVVTYVDWHVNNNTRETTTDWQVFGALFFIVIVVKIIYYVAISRRRINK